MNERQNADHGLYGGAAEVPISSRGGVKMRSLLFVPGDDARKLERSLASGADALILDLEDAVTADRKSAARRLCLEFLDAHAGRSDQPLLFVRINALSTGLGLVDLAAVLRGRPHGVMVPKATGGADMERIGAYLSALEVRDGLVEGSTCLLPIITELGAAMFDMGSYARCAGPRLCGMLWGGEDLSADLGALENRTPGGEYLLPFAMARAMCLYAAAAAGVVAFDAVYTDFRDTAGLAAEAEAGARAGFGGKAGIHPIQIEPINRAFTPSEADVSRAKAVVDAFAQQPDAGAVAVDGRMLDTPHLKLAHRTLRRAGHVRER